MRFVLAAALCASLHAASLRGVVVEDASGRPLARALVVVQPIAGTDAATQSVRSNHDGQFEFGSLAAGAYLVLTSRRGFAPAQYGQKQWKGSGVPVVLAAGGTAQIEIRLQRFGSIAGTVLDENDVGLPDHEVVAYRNTRPPALVAHAQTDDRGMYRFLDLEPGAYLVRTVGNLYDEGAYLPTFARQTMRTNEAYVTEVRLDRESDRVDIRPFPGRLYRVTGHLYPAVRATVTLISDAGVQSVGSDERGGFEFPPVAPGQYELYAAGRGTAGYQPISVDRQYGDYRVTLGALPELGVRFQDAEGRPVDGGAAQVLIRHRDLASTGPPATFRSPMALTPGRWELALAPSPTYYAARFPGSRGQRADGWNEIEAVAGMNAEYAFVLSPHPAGVHGAVSEGGNMVAGVPVYLDADGLETRMTRTDTAGRYEFYGLAPGRYRVLATFDADAPDAGRPVDLQEGQDQSLDLGLYKAQ